MAAIDERLSDAASEKEVDAAFALLPEGMRVEYPKQALADLRQIAAIQKIYQSVNWLTHPLPKAQ